MKKGLNIMLNYSKKHKPKYVKPDSVKELERMAMEAARIKHPTIPEYAIAPRKFRDDKANDLTKCIIEYIKLKQGFATRLNSTGIYRNDIKKFVPNTQRKGMPDIFGLMNGLTLFIEVKIGYDKMSLDQGKVKNEAESNGAKYFIAKNFTDFKSWIDNLINNE